MADETPSTGFFARPPQRPAATPAFRPPAPPSAAPTPTALPDAPTAAGDTTPRPWMRWSARTVDIGCAGALLGLVMGLVAPSVVQATPNMVLGMLAVFVWVFVEAAMLSTWGTTPGKWMFPVMVRTARGTKLDGGAALSRSFAVWIRGLGLGIPLVSLFTYIKAYNRLKAQGQTSWDADGGYVVTHPRQGAAQKVVIAGFVVLMLALLVLGAIARR